MTSFLMIFRRLPITLRRFPKILQTCSEGQTNVPEHFREFPRISEDLPKLFRRPDKRSRTFSKKSRKFPKISEDCRRLSRKTRRCFDDAPTNLRETWYQWNHRYLYMWGYCIVFITGGPDVVCDLHTWQHCVTFWAILRECMKMVRKSL